MIEDIQLKKFRASARTSEYDQDLLMEYETQFFSDKAPTKRKKGAKRRRTEKSPLEVTGQRQAALSHIRALDHQLVLALGIGLIAFVAASGVTDMDIVLAYLMDGILPPTLSLHLDEGSPAYSMTWFLANRVDLRIVSIRDIFHREWNDMKLVLSDAHMWHIVVMLVVVYNMPHGPWDSGAWFNKLRDTAQTIAENMDSSNPMFNAFYELICSDRGVPATGDPHHKAQIWSTIFANNAFKVRGPKVSLRRWFGWIEASDTFLPVWHSVLLSLFCMGQVLGVYRHWSEFPLWNDKWGWVKANPDDEVLSGDDAESEGSDEDDDADQPNARQDKRDKGDAAAAQAAAEAIKGAQSTHALASEEKGPVKSTPHELVKQIRANTKNTAFACSFILCRENCKAQVAMITEMIRPVWTAHSTHARECRDSDACLKYYEQSALGHSYMAVLIQTSKILLNTRLLAKIGFTTEFGGMTKTCKATDADVQAENSNAFSMVDMFCSIVFHRVGSMLYHSRALPGYLALLSSTTDNTYDLGRDRLKRDYAVYLEALDKAEASTYIQKLLKSSPFTTRLVREVALMVTSDLPDLCPNERRHKIQKYVYYIFSGWGQTKVVEDNFKVCRYVETQGQLNNTRTIQSYYTAMAKSDTIGLHKRQEIREAEDEPLASDKPSQTFYCKHHQPSVPDTEAITGKATWSTFSPQSSKTIQADLMLLDYISANKAWASADKCNQCEFFQRRSIILRKADNQFFVVAGALAKKILVVWKVESVVVPRTNHKAFLIGTDTVDNTSPSHLVVLKIEDFLIVPAAPVCPQNYFLALKKEFPRKLGVVLLQHGKPMPVLQYAAQQAFWDIGLPRLKALCKEWEIEVAGVALAPTVTACVKFFLHFYSHQRAELRKMPTDQELQAIISLRCAEQNTLVGDLCDEDMLLEVLEKDDQQVLKVFS